MPLIKSAKPAAFKQNIRTEMAAGRPQKQAVAIAYSQAREAKAATKVLHGGSEAMRNFEDRKCRDC